MANDTYTTFEDTKKIEICRSSGYEFEHLRMYQQGFHRVRCSFTVRMGDSLSLVGMARGRKVQAKFARRSDLYGAEDGVAKFLVGL
ncbi:MAG: hypothetical protein CMO44_16370 [Verrucomicrobiales bacterium]|nr:hypothetical protein [Verrucomicrobiales bacterium]